MSRLDRTMEALGLVGASLRRLGRGRWTAALVLPGPQVVVGTGASPLMALELAVAKLEARREVRYHVN